MATALFSMLLLSACRRAAGRALNNLASKLLEPASANVTFAEEDYDGILPRFRGFASSDGLLHGVSRVALLHCLDASIVDLVSEGTYYGFCRRSISR